MIAAHADPAPAGAAAHPRPGGTATVAAPALVARGEIGQIVHPAAAPVAPAPAAAIARPVVATAVMARPSAVSGIGMMPARPARPRVRLRRS